MLKGLLKKGLLKDAGNILQIFKDNKGRFSSKRTVAGAIAGIAVASFSSSGTITWQEIILCALAAVIVVLSPVVDAKSKDEYPQGEFKE